MTRFMKIAGEHSGRPPPYPPTEARGVEILGSYPTALCPAAAALANGGMSEPAHGRIELRPAYWVAAALAALCGLMAYALWSSANHEVPLGEVVTPSEPAVYALVVSPAFSPSEPAAIEPGEVAMQPLDSRSQTREVLARRLAREKDAIATRHALLTRHRIAISRPVLGPSPEPWPTLEFERELERLTARAVHDLPAAVVDTVIHR